MGQHIEEGGKAGIMGRGISRREWGDRLEMEGESHRNGLSESDAGRGSHASHRKERESCSHRGERESAKERSKKGGSNIRGGLQCSLIELSNRREGAKHTVYEKSYYITLI